MCYNAVQLTNKILKDAERLKASVEELNDIKHRFHLLEKTDYYHINGFEHKKLIAFNIVEDQLKIDTFSWGIIPSWAQNRIVAKDIQAKTINVRGETMQEKPAFKNSALNHRCIIPLTGFFEHHAKNGKRIPHYIFDQKNKDLLIAGLYSDWTDNESGEIIRSASIVTSAANEFMSHIHNNPKMEVARMPLILTEDNAYSWLRDPIEKVQKLVTANHEISLEAHTVLPLSGNKYPGNCPQIIEKHNYLEMNDQLNLFD